MKILYNNEIKNATITATVENPDYPFSTGLLDSRLSRLSKTVNIDDQDIVFAFSGATTVEYAVILNHNLTSSATVKLQANTSDSWTTPIIDESFTAYGDSLVCEITSSNYQYWRVFIDDPTNTDGELSIGYIFLGQALTMPGMARPKKISHSSNSLAQKSTSGQLYGDRRLKYKAAEVDFPEVTETQRQQIKTFWDTVDVVQPFVMLIWEDDLDVEEPIYSSLTKELEWNQQDIEGLLWTLNLSFEEVF